MSVEQLRQRLEQIPKPGVGQQHVVIANLHGRRWVFIHYRGLITGTNAIWQGEGGSLHDYPGLLRNPTAGRGVFIWRRAWRRWCTMMDDLLSTHGLDVIEDFSTIDLDL